MSFFEFENLIKTSTEKGSVKLYKKASDALDNELLKYDDFPKAHFEMIIRTLSVPELYEKPGAWHFLLILSTESTLSSEQYEELAGTFVENYQNYEDGQLCLTVCDFIAYNFSYSDAKNLFEKLDDIEQKKKTNLQGYIREGRRLMEAEKKRNRGV